MPDKPVSLLREFWGDVCGAHRSELLTYFARFTLASVAVSVIGVLVLVWLAWVGVPQ